MLDEGYIKFKQHWTESPPLPAPELAEVIHFRQKCFSVGFIGVYAESRIGFGNISVRYRKSNQFIISGTQTGHIQEIRPEHFTLVTAVDFKENALWCAGPIKASSESLTHAVFYELSEDINCVLHIHHGKMWDDLKFKVPTTGADVLYGSLEMVNAVRALYLGGQLPEHRILVMAGHEEGIVSFGKTPEEAYNVLLQWAR